MQGSFKPLKVPPGEAPAVPMFLINVLVSRPPLENRRTKHTSSDWAGRGQMFKASQKCSRQLWPGSGSDKPSGPGALACAEIFQGGIKMLFLAPETTPELQAAAAFAGLLAEIF